MKYVFLAAFAYAVPALLLSLWSSAVAPLYLAPLAVMVGGAILKSCSLPRQP